MKKLSLSIFLFLFCFSSFAEINAPKRYAMLMVFGMGAYKSKTVDEQEKIPEQLRDGGVERLFYTSHYASSSVMKKMIEKVFDCEKGVQRNENLGMIVLGMSWGARNSYNFSKMYHKLCGRKADRGYMLDGIQKIASSFKKAPIASVCKNYYKTITPVRGKELKNCENFNLTEEVCKNSDGTYQEGFPCHLSTLKGGFKLSLEDISQNALY